MQPLETLTASVLDAVARGAADGALDPVDLLFLLRRYTATDAVDLRDALGRALAAALARPRTDAPLAERAGWLVLFVDALGISDDDRLRAAAFDLFVSLVDDSPRASRVLEAMLAVDACLRAVPLRIAARPAALVIDSLEHTIAHAYRPGAGLAPGVHDGGAPRIFEQFAGAAALLTAYDTTGRLPYAMLAEELVQFARRLWWDDTDGAYREASSAGALDVNCRAVRVLSRLAALHRDPEYLSTAVVAPSADYRRDAGRILMYFRDATTAGYGLALAEYVDLQ